MPVTSGPVSITASTRCCAIFGHPIRHSASPAMHNAAFTERGLNFCYLAYDVRPEDLAAALDGARTMQFLGLNLTVPHKQRVVPMLDLLDGSAEEWGAVNTVCFEGRGADGAWRSLREFVEESPEAVRSRGYNTDAHGLVTSLREDLAVNLKGSRAILLGAGGAGRVAALQLAEEGVTDLFLINRTESKSRDLAAEIARRWPGINVRTEYPDDRVDLLINATSLGLRPDDPLPIDLERFPLGDAGAVYDMIYRPAKTHLLQAAEKAGVRAVNGLGMLLHQGARAFELWTGTPAPLDTMRAALHEEIYGD